MATGRYSYTVTSIDNNETLEVTFGDGTIRNVDRAYVKANKDRETFVLVDVRPASFYWGQSYDPALVAGGHIPGAVHVPLAEIESFSLGELASRGITPDRTVILYCNTGRTSRTAADVLVEKGFTNLRNYLGSMNDWGAQPDETVVIAGLELQIGVEETGVVSVDVPEGVTVTWSLGDVETASVLSDDVVALSATTGRQITVDAVAPGEARLIATADDRAKSEATVIVTAAPGGSSGGCGVGFTPAVVLLLLPLVLLKK